MNKNRRPEVFNDGKADFYSVKNCAEKGDMPKDKLEKIYLNIRYSERVTGITRYFAALQNDIKISLTIRVPRLNAVSTQDICVIGGEQYKIVSLQHKNGLFPPCSDISLERIAEKYEFR